MAPQTSEACRRAALALANAARQTHCSSAIFSSVFAGDGATTASVYIGRHLLRDLGFNPVLIELNRIRPALAQLFRLDTDRSMAAVASGSANVVDCVQKDPAGLSIIPAGKV